MQCSITLILDLRSSPITSSKIQLVVFCPLKKGRTVNFSVDVSDPEGDALTYLWSFGDCTDFDGDGVGDTAVSSDVLPSYTYTSRGSYRVDLTVTESNGASTVFAPVSITVGNPPEPAITSISSQDKWRAGEPFTLLGFANDLEDGLIPDSNLTLNSAYYLDGLGRPGPLDQAVYDPAEVTFSTPSSGTVQSYLNSLRIILTATDSDGLSTSRCSHVSGASYPDA